MMEFITSDGGRIVLLLLAGVGMLLQFDNLIDAIRARKKGGDSDSTAEKPSPPSGTDWRV